jgi:uncharacterized protein with FMN-binding domain
MKKYFAIFAAVALLGMLAIYFAPINKKTSGTEETTQISASSTPTSAPVSATTTRNATQNASASVATTATSSLRDGTYNGDTVSTRFGDVQVAITVSAGKITNVDFLALPDEDMRSSMISQQASPSLESQTLATQSANIDGVSGATYTSEGYIQSLQAAIDNSKV